MSSPSNLNAGMRCIKFIIFVISFMFGVSLATIKIRGIFNEWRHAEHTRFRHEGKIFITNF